MIDKLKEKVGLIGNGELGKQLENLLSEVEPTCSIIPFDDNSNFLFDEYKNHIQTYYWLIGIGYKHLEARIEIINKIQNEGGHLKSIIHQTCYISPKAKMEEGVICYPRCNIDKGVTIKSGALLNNSVVISHDSIIGEGSYISPGVVISGNAQIGKGCFIGAGAIISDSIKIGSFARIGIGTVITKDVPENSWVIGNPQRILDQPFRL